MKTSTERDFYSFDNSKVDAGVDTISIIKDVIANLEYNVNVIKGREILASWINSRIFGGKKFSKMSKNGVINIASLAFKLGAKLGVDHDIVDFENTLNSCTKND